MMYIYEIKHIHGVDMRGKSRLLICTYLYTYTYNVYYNIMLKCVFREVFSTKTWFYLNVDIINHIH